MKKYDKKQNIPSFDSLKDDFDTVFDPDDNLYNCQSNSNTPLTFTKKSPKVKHSEKSKCLKIERNHEKFQENT